MTLAAALLTLAVSSCLAVPPPDLTKSVHEAGNAFGAEDPASSSVAALERPAGVPVDVPQDLPAKIQACSELLAKDPPAPCVPPPPADTCKPVQTQAHWRLVPSGQWPAIKDDLKPESAITAIDRTLRYWKARGGQCAQIGTLRLVKAEQLAAGLAQLRELISTLKDPSELAKQLDLRFDVYESLPDAAPQGQITGYFAPDIPLSTTGGPGKVPVLGRPKDLVRNPDPNACPRFGRMESDRFVPYFKRRELMTNRESDLKLWVDHPADLYSIQTEGSGFGILPDGRKILLGYAAGNGYKWRGLAGVLRRCKIAETQDAQQFYDYLKELRKTRPELEQKIIDLDDSYSFFDRQSGGPRGAANVELIPGRSIAVDPACIPLGMPGLMASTLPSSDPANRREFTRFVFSHDVGGAIRGCARADLYMGDGPEAEADANRMNAAGGLFVFVPK